MPFLFSRLERASRFVILFLGLASLAMGRIFWNIRADEKFLPNFWPYWYLVAGLVTICYAVAMRSRRLMMASGVFVVVGYASRVGALIVTWQTGGSLGLTPERFLLGAIVWSIPTVLTAFLWVVIFRTLADFHHNR